jgi:hypothetical protein
MDVQQPAQQPERPAQRFQPSSRMKVLRNVHELICAGKQKECGSEAKLEKLPLGGVGKRELIRGIEHLDDTDVIGAVVVTREDKIKDRWTCEFQLYEAGWAENTMAATLNSKGLHTMPNGMWLAVRIPVQRVVVKNVEYTVLHP